MSEGNSVNHIDELTFDAPHGRAEQTLGAIALVMFIVAGFAFQIGMSARGGDALLWKVIGFLPIAVAGLLWFGSPRRYTLGEDSLHINSAFSQKSIEYKAIKKVESFREGELELSDGSPLPSALLTYLHRPRHAEYGKLIVKSNRLFPAIIILTCDESLLLSSNDNREFVTALKRRIQ
ncbi:MAG TPA: hypothetical protein ENN75_03415 [candidate division Zixibacteria bacterium]|nr:hypothetical protein [candidate division Zixibacteria bacterium]